MKLYDLVVLGVFGAAAYAVRRAMRPGPRPTPAALFVAEMERPGSTQRAESPDPLYGLVRRARPHHAPYSLN